MDSSELSVAIIQEREMVVHAALEEMVPALLEGDLATMEQQAQRLGFSRSRAARSAVAGGFPPKSTYLGTLRPF